MSSGGVKIEKAPVFEPDGCCRYCGTLIYYGRKCWACGGTLEGYPSKRESDGELMPFHYRGVLWVYCLICDREVKVADSVRLSGNGTLRMCRRHVGGAKGATE